MDHDGHEHGHEHGHAHQVVPSDLALRVNALESLLVEKGLVDPAALDDRHALVRALCDPSGQYFAGGPGPDHHDIEFSFHSVGSSISLRSPVWRPDQSACKRHHEGALAVASGSVPFRGQGVAGIGNAFDPQRQNRAGRAG